MNSTEKLTYRTWAEKFARRCCPGNLQSEHAQSLLAHRTRTQNSYDSKAFFWLERQASEQKEHVPQHLAKTCHVNLHGSRTLGRQTSVGIGAQLLKQIGSSIRLFETRKNPPPRLSPALVQPGRPAAHQAPALPGRQQVPPLAALAVRPQELRLDPRVDMQTRHQMHQMASNGIKWQDVGRCLWQKANAR